MSQATITTRRELRKVHEARIREALALIDIRVLDHLIVTAASVASMAEKGLI